MNEIFAQIWFREARRLDRELDALPDEILALQWEGADPRPFDEWNAWDHAWRMAWAYDDYGQDHYVRPCCSCLQCLSQGF